MTKQESDQKELAAARNKTKLLLMKLQPIKLSLKTTEAGLTTQQS